MGWVGARDPGDRPGNHVMASLRTANASDSAGTGSLHRRSTLLAFALALALPATLALPAIGAADSLYWSDSSTGALRTGNLNDTVASALLTGLREPLGIAVDPAAGLIYWAEAATGTIQVGSLNGTGTAQTLWAEPGAARPADLAIDAAVGKLFWTDAGTGQVVEASTAGSGHPMGGTPHVLYSEPEAAHPTGIAIDSAAGKLYWTDEGTDEIREGALAGGAARTLYKEPGGSRPSGVAVAASTSRLYWTDAGNDLGTGTVRYAPLSGSGEGQTLYTDSVGSAPRGPALDAATGALYWGDSDPAALRVGSLAGGGSAQSLFSTGAGAAYPALLAAPHGEGAPQITGAVAIGQTLSCGNGKWAANAPGANFYEAPQSYAYQWQLNGVDIAGAQSASYTPNGEGSFTCVLTATNAGGSATQTSAVTVIKAAPPVAAGPPTVSISSPVSGVSYEQGQAVSTSFSCKESAGGPGLASCTDSNGTSPPSGYLKTTSLGLFTYTVTAVSKDGERSTASINYLVIARKAPPGPPAPVASVKSPTIEIKSSFAQVSGRTTKVALLCGGAASCRGTLSLTYLSTTPTHDPPRTTQVPFARTRYVLASRQRRGVLLKLSAPARQLLLKARGHHLTVRARATITAGATKERAVTLHLR